MASQAPDSAPVAWQPITLKGVAAFANASLGRLHLYQFFFAAFNAIAVVWLLHTAICPVIQTAVERLPQAGEFKGGELFWHGDTPALLSEGRLLSIAVDMDHTGRARVPSDVFIEFGKRSWRIFSIGGYAEAAYASKTGIAANRPELEPWWGAWRAPLLAMAFLGWTLLLLILWAAQASLYFPAAWLVAFYSNRKAGAAQAWRLCGAAMMPASLLLWLGIVLYGSAALSLIGFSLVIAGHLLVGWAYVLLAPVRLPGDPAAAYARKNPFVTRKAG